MDCSDLRRSCKVCIWHRVNHFIQKLHYLEMHVFGYPLRHGNLNNILSVHSTYFPGVLVIQILRTESYSRNHRCVVVRAPWVHSSPSVRQTNERPSARLLSLSSSSASHTNAYIKSHKKEKTPFCYHARLDRAHDK